MMKLYTNLKNKKAVTPLMISLLLVSFAIAVGVVIMNLGQAQVEEGAVCPITLDMKFAMISGTEHICYDAAKKEIVFTVENGLNAPIEGILVNVIGAQNAANIELEAKMSFAGAYVGHVPFDTMVNGEIRQIKISPATLLKGERQLCPEQALMMEQVVPC